MVSSVPALRWSIRRGKRWARRCGSVGFAFGDRQAQADAQRCFLLQPAFLLEVSSLEVLEATYNTTLLEIVIDQQLTVLSTAPKPTKVSLAAADATAKVLGVQTRHGDMRACSALVARRSLGRRALDHCCERTHLDGNLGGRGGRRAKAGQEFGFVVLQFSAVRSAIGRWLMVPRYDGTGSQTGGGGVKKACEGIGREAGFGECGKEQLAQLLADSGVNKHLSLNTF